MTTSMLARCAAAALLLSACGGDDDSAADAGPGGDSAAAIDADTTDASVVDCQADHREAGEIVNNPFREGGGAENTGLALSGGGDPFTVCGQMDPTETMATLVDLDAFAFEVTGNAGATLRIELVAPEGANLSELTLRLYEAGEGPPVHRAKGVFRNGYGLIAGLHVEPGLYWVAVAAATPEPEDAVGYTITVSHDAFDCAAASGDPDYLENDDGAGRGNDVVAIHYPDPPAATGGDDAAEVTGETVAADETLHLRGVSAALDSDGDSYLDRDTFRINTADDATELQVRLSWPDPVGDDGADLDLYLFASGALEEEFSMRLGAVAGDEDDEVFTVNVDPSRGYWIWVGAFDDTGQGGAGALPVTYDVTVCARAHDAD